ncbi:cytochrome P450 [Muricoccus radiodurans]|uniref:cytochrome P450 n=1 Tax=Muricoccus radiodurans TaxID=2231721 RepID=UPI003CF70AA5
MTTIDAARSTLPRASLPDTMLFLSAVVMPLIGKGVILRRPPMVAAAERLGLDRGAVRTMQRLRRRYGPGPVLLPVPLHPYAVVLSPEHATRVLRESPEPFATASDEKRSSLSHFEPHGVLISDSRERAHRRPFNEAVLDTPCPAHRLAERFLSVVEEECAGLAFAARQRGTLRWSDFAVTWWRMARRVTFGDGAREDHELTDLLARLRADANWAFLHPRRDRVRARFMTRLRAQLDRAEPGSLAAVMASTAAAPGTDPAGQVPQWLFAYDGPARATFRTLAMLATHPAEAEQARADIAAAGPGTGLKALPYIRACVLDTLRLWPTTPVLLRQVATPVDWANGRMAAGTGVIIFSPFFHRDGERLAQADRFSPETWLKGRPEEMGFVPFSDGPAECPGRNLALMLSSATVASLMREGAFTLERPAGIGPHRPLPGTLSAYGLRFRMG